MKERIYELILERRYFRISDITEELWKEYGEIFSRSFIRNKVKDFVEVMVGQGLLKVLSEYDPPIFENPVAEEEKPLRELLKKCPVCGKDFFPRRGKQDKYCCRKCYERAKARRRRVDTRKRVSRYMHSADSSAVNHNQPWTKQEESFLIENKGKLTYREIAEKLGRTVYSVRWRARKLGLTGEPRARQLSPSR